MPTIVPDLWPADIFTMPSSTPIAVLRQQGEALGAHTHNFVHGEVETTSTLDGKQFAHTLYLSAPLLRYRKPLIRVDQPQPQPYPATIVETDLTKQHDKNYWSSPVRDEQELQDRLREFFNELRVKEILRAVFNLSNDVAPPDGP
ncbi:hypothetical protein J8F10_16200 [Gemmata sp. G18]|uniref:Uncharacterized protein n=1 Tax=Gemmata palustris TaxID=2822762 RepID=A0ABS5BT49_9BACT|nr:hypothetical protein [Gemmata palustris]MBP3956816.1 hypothetical protein [Gemmata palustris]